MAAYDCTCGPRPCQGPLLLRVCEGVAGTSRCGQYGRANGRGLGLSKKKTETDISSSLPSTAFFLSRWRNTHATLWTRLKLLSQNLSGSSSKGARFSFYAPPKISVQHLMDVLGPRLNALASAVVFQNRGNAFAKKPPNSPNSHMSPSKAPKASPKGSSPKSTPKGSADNGSNVEVLESNRTKRRAAAQGKAASAAKEFAEKVKAAEEALEKKRREAEEVKAAVIRSMKEMEKEHKEAAYKKAARTREEAAQQEREYAAAAKADVQLSRAAEEAANRIRIDEQRAQRKLDEERSRRAQEELAEKAEAAKAERERHEKELATELLRRAEAAAAHRAERFAQIREAEFERAKQVMKEAMTKNSRYAEEVQEQARRREAEMFEAARLRAARQAAAEAPPLWQKKFERKADRAPVASTPSASSSSASCEAPPQASSNSSDRSQDEAVDVSGDDGDEIPPVETPVLEPAVPMPPHPPPPPPQSGWRWPWDDTARSDATHSASSSAEAYTARASRGTAEYPQAFVESDAGEEAAAEVLARARLTCKEEGGSNDRDEMAVERDLAVQRVMSKNSKTLRDALGLKPLATDQQVSKRLRQLLRLLHPDASINQPLKGTKHLARIEGAFKKLSALKMDAKL